ncbi:MAG: class I SAM-dependent methyltransferase [Selenomonadaceae bacterium]|nr:class I SAM-dependent methyltransferase [Selenomonadaceae bacterium]
MQERRCRFCHAPLKETFVDLGMAPLSNSYIPQDASDQGQMTFPLHAYVCEKCFLVQLEEYETPQDIFSDYAYFSSYSTSWLKHAETYTLDMLRNYGIGHQSQVIEVASNDGYLLQYFKRAGVPVLGIEPARNVAKEAMKKRGIPTLSEFFGRDLAQKLRAEGRIADLLIGNNVLAHVPDINDFVAGLQILLADDGFITMEFPHLMQLMGKVQFDTIYHEHFSYLSLLTVQQIFSAHGLRIFHVEELPTHGGSLRIFACHKQSQRFAQRDSVEALLAREQEAGMEQLSTYLAFPQKVREIKYSLLSTLIRLKREGKHIVGYGAAAKGNTLLNYCGIRTEFLDYVADRSPHKQHTLLPGSRIPVVSPEEIMRTKPDYVLILPWNLCDEIMTQMQAIRSWGAKYIVPIPEVRIF